jgi:hypothetical protein
MSTTQNISKKDQGTEKTKISICDLTKNNTSEIIQKMEFQTPIFLQGYADLFTKYFHSFNATFGACRISEKQFFDKMGIDHTVMEEIASYWNFVKNMTVIQIETYSKFIQDYIEFRIATIDSVEKLATAGMDYYSKVLSDINKK